MGYLSVPDRLLVPGALLRWYDANGRHQLPWKHPTTAYRVWVSEVMLQQTQVTRVLEYFPLFMQRFPDVASLAAASLDDVLALWAGLGYYRRARNLHLAAQQVCARHGGEIPRSQSDLQALPGIGRTTAAAIRAQYWNEWATILDGNVKRVLSRIFAVAGDVRSSVNEKRLWTLAEALTPQDRPGDYCQAIMDFGATLCTRANPGCDCCPVARHCRALALGRVSEFPAPNCSPSLPQRRLCMPIIRDQRGAVLLLKRPSNGIWGGLWSLPECDPQADVETVCRRLTGISPVAVVRQPELRHNLTHIRLSIVPLWLQLPGVAALVVAELDSRQWALPSDWRGLGLPTPVSTLLKHHGVTNDF